MRFAALDWCEDKLRRELPDDPDQFIEVRRLNRRERDKCNGLATRARMSEVDGASLNMESIELDITVGRVKDFEYEHCITDFALKDGEGRAHRFGKPDRNKRIYDHFTPEMARFVDEMIAELNKDDEIGKAEVEAVEGNSDGSLGSSSPASEDQ